MVREKEIISRFHSSRSNFIHRAIHSTAIKHSGTF